MRSPRGRDSPFRVVAARANCDELVGVFRRNRPEAATPHKPNADLMALVDTTGSAARAAKTLNEAIGLVLRDVSDAAGWMAGHAWGRGNKTNTWVSLGVWHPDDGIGLGELRRVVVEAAQAPARGHLALALHLEGTQWVSGLAGWTGTPTYDAAVAAGVRSAVACPVYVNGEAVALLEWYLPTDKRPSPDVAHVLGHLSAVLSEVAERPVHAVPEQGRLRGVRETLKWVTEDGVMARLLTA